MFDISFFELMMCAVVALVVIGPERLPETVRTVGLWIGRLKRSLRETRSELEKQLGADDIRRQLHNEEIMNSLAKTRREIESAIKEGEQALHTHTYVEHHELPDHAHGDDTAEPGVIANDQPHTAEPSASASDTLTATDKSSR